MEIFSLIILGLVIGFIASYWIIFTKAGESGWKCLIPIYNLIIMLRIARKQSGGLYLSLLKGIS